MWKRHFWSLFYHNTRWKKYFFEKSKKSQFFKTGRRPAAGWLFWAFPNRPPAGLDFGDLVSEKVKKLKIELFERFSIKSGLTDVWSMSMLYHWMNIHLRITFFGLQNQNLIFCKTGRRFKFVEKPILLKVAKLYHQCRECLRTGLWVLFHLEKDLGITFDLADNNRKNDPKQVSWENRPAGGRFCKK